MRPTQRSISQSEFNVQQYDIWLVPKRWRKSYKSLDSQICAGLKSYEVATTEGVDEKVTPPTSYSFQCSAETGDRCQFPFGVKGEDGVQWSCVGEEGQAKCSPGSNDATSSWTTDKKLRIFQSQSNFHNCVDCNLSEIQLPCPFFGVIYIGFPLGTYAGNNFSHSSQFGRKAT